MFLNFNSLAFALVLAGHFSPSHCHAICYVFGRFSIYAVDIAFVLYMFWAHSSIVLGVVLLCTTVLVVMLLSEHPG